MSGRRWIALVVLVAIGVGLLVAIVAVPWGDDAPASNAPSLYHQGDAITVATGEEFIVAVPANPSPGYSWTASDDPDVTLVSSHQVAGGSQPGASGAQELVFRAERAGQSTLELAYARSFEPGVPPAKTATFPLTVTK
jgi:inhibitor of cysteine peptidase